MPSGFTDSSWQVVGLSEALAKFREIEGLAETELDPAVKDGGEIVAEDARRRAPVDTGRLASEEGIIVDEETERDGDVVYVKVGPSKKAWYGRFQEWGTSKVGAQPFMRPARDSQRKGVVQVIGSRLSAALRRL